MRASGSPFGKGEDLGKASHAFRTGLVLSTCKVPPSPPRPLALGQVGVHPESLDRGQAQAEAAVLDGRKLGAGVQRSRPAGTQGLVWGRAKAMLVGIAVCGASQDSFSRELFWKNTFRIEKGWVNLASCTTHSVS